MSRPLRPPVVRNVVRNSICFPYFADFWVTVWGNAGQWYISVFFLILFYFKDIVMILTECYFILSFTLHFCKLSITKKSALFG